MKLSDVMSAMKLATYAEAGLVLFLLAFVLVVFDLMRSKPIDMENARLLPLSDEPGPKSEDAR